MVVSLPKIHFCDVPWDLGLQVEQEVLQLSVRFERDSESVQRDRKVHIVDHCHQDWRSVLKTSLVVLFAANSREWAASLRVMVSAEIVVEIEAVGAGFLPSAVDCQDFCIENTFVLHDAQTKTIGNDRSKTIGTFETFGTFGTFVRGRLSKNS